MSSAVTLGSKHPASKFYVSRGLDATAPSSARSRGWRSLISPMGSRSLTSVKRGARRERRPLRYSGREAGGDAGRDPQSLPSAGEEAAPGPQSRRQAGGGRGKAS